MTQSSSGSIGIMDFGEPMTIQTNLLTELLKIFPGNATVRGFEEGLTVKNADGSGEVIMMNDNYPVSHATETNRTDPAPSAGTTAQEAQATSPTDARKLWLVPPKSVSITNR
jgi:hypothetical protein